MRHAVVVGGGVGGLAAALALGRAGWRVTVLERAPAFAEIGAGITLPANARRALHALGLADVVGSGAPPQEEGGVRDPSGRWLVRLGGARAAGAGAEAARAEPGTTGTRSGADAEAVVVGIHRQHLHRLLLDAVPPDALVSGARVVSVRAAGAGRASVTFVRGGTERTATADLVVGADGIRSRVRSELWPEHPGPRYSGVTAWRSVTRGTETVQAGVTSTWGPGTEFGIVPLLDGRVYWFAAAPAPEGERSADELGDLRRRFRHWHAPIPALLASGQPEDVLRHDLYELGRPLRSFVRGPVALLGDAAHAMTPHLGQGAAQALEDAVVLGRACAPDRPVEVSLAVYDRTRRPRAQAVATASRWAGRVGHELRLAPAVALRNAVMRRLPAALALRPLTRFTRWDPDPLSS
ncbi:2-polyprenyl-6-methoxyphenol hydroxylase-like FAD-dependent oxidoreductase [Georgenia soli]|uniref:2-polyprenyl-6-methoxyphenol hydroxylase-like FAD-dependent oxidoreductase n=1 Tax=Georgenia soli TaxID=638953 RepID=A0A2A9EH17_9MICO|nr:FAD-dependent monooxygenase [Georgenia soli]PFG37916.1 2-polyprenyl-6-methoxyphenol hydroxylase-like FAD-dependent oxidoreductase [Georgenia soli]